MKKVVVVAGALLLASLPSSALAHRCDNCFEPRKGPPGTTVTIERLPRTYKVTWNENQYYAEMLFQPDQPTFVLFRGHRNSPEGPITFRVPDVPSGKYAVSAYDGSERGQHDTYTAFLVTKAASRLPHTGGTFLLPLLAIVAILVVVGFAIGNRSARSRRERSETD